MGRWLDEAMEEKGHPTTGSFFLDDIENGVGLDEACKKRCIRPPNIVYQWLRDDEFRIKFAKAVLNIQ